jgi:hypothetical protein
MMPERAPELIGMRMNPPKAYYADGRHGNSSEAGEFSSLEKNSSPSKISLSSMSCALKEPPEKHPPSGSPMSLSSLPSCPVGTDGKDAYARISFCHFRSHLNCMSVSVHRRNG